MKSNQNHLRHLSGPGAPLPSQASLIGSTKPKDQDQLDGIDLLNWWLPDGMWGGRRAKGVIRPVCVGMHCN